jgi:hypothetical protein
MSYVRVLASLSAITGIFAADASRAVALAQAEPKPTFEIYGFAQADLIFATAKADPDWKDGFRPSKISTDPSVFGSGSQTSISVKQSRFGVQGDVPVSDDLGAITFKFEIDMFGVGADAGQTTIRLRHAFGKWGPILAGQTNMMFDNIPSALPHIKSGKLIALATTGAKRDPALPDLPTVAESGVKGYESGVWFGIMVPAGTPRDVVMKLNAAAVQATKAPDFIKRMTDLGYSIIPGSPEDMGKMLEAELKRWAPIVKASGAKVD